MKNTPMGKQPKIDNKPDAKKASKQPQSTALPSGKNDPFAPKGKQSTRTAGKK